MDSRLMEEYLRDLRARQEKQRPAELEAWARTAMAAYKVPRVALVTEFPMTTTGKIRKVELVERAQQLVAAR